MRALLAVLIAPICLAQFQEISARRIEAHVKFLSSDLLEGRGVGTRGGEIAAEYLAAQLASAGARPAGEDGGWFQRVRLLGVRTEPEASLQVQSPSGNLPLAWLTDVVGGTERQSPLEEFDAEMVFVGHGITAPEFQWDDYSGIDVSGKVVLMFTNEPPSRNPKFFAGPALTYFGRWSYKFEQAQRKGAVAAVLIHTDATAGYGWDVVRNSWGGEEAQRQLANPSAMLAFSGWVNRQAGERLLKIAGYSVADLLKRADTRGFRGFPLRMRLRGRIPSKLRRFESRNVAAVVRGSDPRLSGEAVVFSSHWDHLGIGPQVNGDSIYNGAVDNATGCALLVEMARAWASLDPKPRRSAIFLATAAEESGLLGSEHYATHPAFPLDKTALALNFDSYFPVGIVREVIVDGAERTTLWPQVEDAAKRMRLTIQPDPRPEEGSFFRSDHFSFAKAGVPAFSIRMGGDFQDYEEHHYHRPSDEYRDNWEFTGMEQMARFGFLVGLSAANAGKITVWNPGTEFAVSAPR